jgi:hypothetical protein
MATTSAEDQVKAGPLFEQAYDDGKVRFTFTVDEHRDTEIVVDGRGTMPGGIRMIELLDETLARFGADGGSRFHFDVARVKGSPLRSQLIFGKWLLKRRRAIGRVAVSGAAPLERRLATAVCTIAGFGNLRFFDRRDEARAWLAADRGTGAAP